MDLTDLDNPRDTGDLVGTARRLFLEPILGFIALTKIDDERVSNIKFCADSSNSVEISRSNNSEDNQRLVLRLGKVEPSELFDGSECSLSLVYLNGDLVEEVGGDELDSNPFYITFTARKDEFETKGLHFHVCSGEFLFTSRVFRGERERSFYYFEQNYRAICIWGKVLEKFGRIIHA